MEDLGQKYMQSGLESFAAGGAIVAKIAERLSPRDETNALLRTKIAETIYRRIGMLRKK